jgi:hypothetical protein
MNWEIRKRIVKKESFLSKTFILPEGKSEIVPSRYSLLVHNKVSWAVNYFRSLYEDLKYFNNDVFYINELNDTITSLKELNDCHRRHPLIKSLINDFQAKRRIAYRNLKNGRPCLGTGSLTLLKLHAKAV